EAAMAASGLALGARQRVLLLRLRMQEHGEIAADRAEAAVAHRLRRLPDHHPVAVAAGDAEQGVAYRAADEVDLDAVHAGDHAMGPARARLRARWRAGRRSPFGVPACRPCAASAAARCR